MKRVKCLLELLLSCKIKVNNNIQRNLENNRQMEINFKKITARI